MTGSAERETVEALATYYDRQPTDDDAPAWFRESVQRAWRVGDRVRIDLGECPARFWHTPFEHGREGTVVSVHADPSVHAFKVKFDEPFGTGGWWFTAWELEPIDPPPGGRPAARAEGEG